MEYEVAAHGPCPAHPPGLRERKKTETRAAIARAAVLLALERGPENVRVADIAAAADVSPRTYNNYFASIPEAICALVSDRALALADAVRARPANEPLAEAVTNAMLGVQEHDDFGKPLVRMITCDSVLRGEFFKAIVARDAALTRVIAERTGTTPDDLYPQVLAAAISGATRVAVHRWLNDDNADFGDVLRAAVAMVVPMAGGSTGEQPASAQRKIARPSPAVPTRLQATG
jgi:AcrR family transcriptional regulator